MFTGLGLRHPILQAPMAGVSTPELAAAVSQAGGLGALGIGASSPGQARGMIAATQALTTRPINVNVFCHQPPPPDPQADAAWLAALAPLFAQFGAAPPATLTEIYPSFLTDDATLRLLLELRPAVVSFHFGLPGPDRIAALRAAGIRTLASATSLAEARAIAAAGIDAIVAQGIEAGGHRGIFDPAAPDERLPMAVLTRLLVCGQPLPVVAAGGIMDGQGIRAALALGAVAAQLGTAFIACPESAADADYRANLAGPAAAETRLTAVLSGRPARGMVNRFIRMAEAPGHPAPAAYPRAYDAAKQLNAAARAAGQPGFAAQWAGQGAPLSRPLPAAQLMQRLVAEMTA